MREGVVAGDDVVLDDGVAGDCAVENQSIRKAGRASGPPWGGEKRSRRDALEPRAVWPPVAVNVVVDLDLFVTHGRLDICRKLEGLLVRAVRGRALIEVEPVRAHACRSGG